MALFVVAAFLLFLIQCLRLFDLVTTRGQNLFTLVGQAALGMPSLAIVVLYVCFGIGLGRALRNLQDRSELQVIHGSALTTPLMRAVVAYALGGSLVLLSLSHIVDPMSVKSLRNWSESIAADLVSRSMIPHRFTEVVDGVSMIIGSRDSQGQITDFFADDTRELGTRRTYFARTALITRDEQGFILRMHDGAIQTLPEGERMSQIAFTRYDLALDELTGDVETGDALASVTSLEIVGKLLNGGKLTRAENRLLSRRSVEAGRVLAICLLVAALAAFPTGNRRKTRAPIELVVLGAAFLERGLSSYIPLPQPLDLAFGPGLLLTIALVILAVRFRILSFVPRRRRVA